MASPGDGTTTLGGGTAISGGGTPDTGCGTPFRPVPAEFNHCRNSNIGRTDIHEQTDGQQYSTVAYRGLWLCIASYAEVP